MKEITIDDESYQVPDVVHRFLNDATAYLEKNPGPGRSDRFGHDARGTPYRELGIVLD